MSRIVSVAPGVVVEGVGDDLMVIVPGRSDVVSLSGRPAQVLANVRSGMNVDWADPALRDLVDLGIVAAPGLSRRGLIKAGAIGVGAGVASLALPTAAYAASVSYVEIAGIWAGFPTGANFEASGFDWPDELGSDSSGTDPSILTVVSLVDFPSFPTPFTVPLFSYDATGGEGDDSVVWKATTGDYSAVNGSNAVGTFSWGGVDYRVTFGTPD